MATDLILSTYVYNSQSIDVPFTPEAFFNATVAAKPFGKMPKDWLKTDETQAYINAIRTKILIEENQLVRVVSGAPETGGGTWLHPKLGIAFARWLDPFFALWCDEQIERILRHDLDILSQTRVHGLLRGLLRDIDKTHDAFARQGMVNQARTLFATLGIPMPDIALLGKPANQTRQPNPAGGLTMRHLDDVLNALLGPDAAAALRGATPTAPAEYEPTDLARKRIELRLRQDRFDDLLRIEQRWVRERLLPSLTCFGCYPPPGAREADLALEDHS